MITDQPDWPTEFRTWLIKMRAFSPASARVYSSRMRSMAAIVEPSGVTHGSVFAYLSTHANARSAYRTLVLFAKEAKGVELPTVEAFPSGPPVTIKPEEELLPRYPEPVLDALCDLLDAGLSVALLKPSCWGHVIYNEERERFEMPDPEEKNTWLIVPSAPLQVLREWVQPAEGQEFYTPLVTAAPQTRLPANWTWLRATVAVRRRSRQES
jgi:hypothetical protein